MNLDEIRRDIDEIDRQLIPLLCRRMDCSRKVADFKKQAGMPVYDAAREQNILDRVAKAAGEYGGAARAVYRSVMEQSRALQYPSVAPQGAEPFVYHAPPEAGAVRRIACQGVDGAYSFEAGRKLFPQAEILAQRQFSDVFDAVERGEAEFGILPVENSWAGSVHEVYDQLIWRRFHIAGAVDLGVQHVLLGAPGAVLSDIRRVYSHQQALRQCAGFLTSHGLEAVEAANTAVAVKTVAQGGDKSAAAIGSRRAGKLYGLQVLAEHIADSDANTTRFIAISKALYCAPEADRISVVFAMPHVTGSLYRTLARFSDAGLNLTKIESRPIRGRQFEYLFYVDLVGSLHDPVTRGMLGALSQELPEFLLLGNYAETACRTERGEALCIDPPQG